ncbi:MAG: DUF2938 domain-containing protein [Vicinamibacterales bacterium]
MLTGHARGLWPVVVATALPAGLDPWTVIAAALVGAGATLSMDLWNAWLKRVFGIPSLNYCLLGRWLCHLGRGTLAHANISAAAPVAGECAAGWAGHYSIGLGLSVVFAIVMPGWFARPTPWPAILYGLGTVVFPLFVLQPALGFGIASARTPNPRYARLKSLATHTVFGVGLYVWALLLGYFGPDL